MLQADHSMHYRHQSVQLFNNNSHGETFSFPLHSPCIFFYRPTFVSSEKLKKKLARNNKNPSTKTHTSDTCRSFSFQTLQSSFHIILQHCHSHATFVTIALKKDSRVAGFKKLAVSRNMEPIIIEWCSCPMLYLLNC